MKNLNEVLQALKTEQENQIDIVLNTKDLDYEKNILNFTDYKMNLHNEVGKKELCGRIGLPYSYYNLLDSEECHTRALKYNVKYWLKHSKKSILIRCHKTPLWDSINCPEVNIRGVLSNKYHIINNYDSASELISQIKRKVSSDISLSKCSFEKDNSKFILEVDIEGLDMDASEITGVSNDVAIMGVTLTNSEIGRAAFELQPYIKTSSGILLLLDHVQTRVHLGSVLDYGIFDGGIDTLSSTHETINDLVSSLISILKVEYLEKYLDNFCNILKSITPQKPIEAIESYLRLIGTTEQESVHALNSFLSSVDKSAMQAYISAISAVIELSEDSDYYSKLDSCRDLALTFGQKGKKRLQYNFTN